MSNQFHTWVLETQNQFGADFEAAILSRLPAFPSRLHEALHYVIQNKGKMIRPLLTMATGKALSCGYEKTLPFALAIEAIHIYSLTHDDLPAMDDDDLRRGKLTCHKLYDDATAILVGDALQAMAFQILSESPLPDATKVKSIATLAIAAGPAGMVGGQMLDITASGNDQALSLIALDQLHSLKTGALIEAAIVMPSIGRSDLPQETLTALSLFAKNIGLAFQIQDDILDITQTTEDLGKPAGSDIGLHKLTYPALLGLEESKLRLHKIYYKAIELIEKIPGDTQYLLGLADMIIHRQN
jgi:farnesyl diphosphate synthase